MNAPSFLHCPEHRLVGVAICRQDRFVPARTTGAVIKLFGGNSPNGAGFTKSSRPTPIVIASDSALQGHSHSSADADPSKNTRRDISKSLKTRPFIVCSIHDSNMVDWSTAWKAKGFPKKAKVLSRMT